ncbi:PAIP1.2 family protein [Megaselia abdita]
MNSAPNIIQNPKTLRRPREAEKVEKPSPDKENTTSSKDVLTNINHRMQALQSGSSLPPPPPTETTVPKLRTQLNHNAVEFKPAHTTVAPMPPPPLQPRNLQDRLNRHQGVPIEEPPLPSEPQHYQEPEYLPTEEELGAVDLIENMANLLAEDPGNFDDFSEQIKNIFEEFYSSEYVMTISMELIFKRSTVDSNFRYMGAKLYNLLDKLQTREQSLFRILLDCKLSFQETEFQELIENNNFEVVSGTLLFLSELFMQMKLDGIGNAILFGIDALLSIVPKNRLSKDTIKSVCFTLKLSGFDLEKKFYDKMTKVLQKLNGFSGETPSIDVLIQNIIVLQKNNWGRRDSITSNTSNGFGDTPAVGNDEPTFYGPDGVALTEEESQFLNSQHDNDSDYEFDEMDQEQGLDFRKFLYSSKRH